MQFIQGLHAGGAGKLSRMLSRRLSYQYLFGFEVIIILGVLFSYVLLKFVPTFSQGHVLS